MSEDFAVRNAAAIHEIWSGVGRRYNVSEGEFAARLAAVARRMSSSQRVSTKKAVVTAESEPPPPAPESNGAELSGADVADERQFLASIKADDLCLALACENGDEAAWLEFESVYRHSMIAAARVLTKDEGEAEDLVQFVYGELYGLRQEGERRLNKLAHYSGRGSLGGWLRAVVYQCFIDRKRVTARFEQVEEVEEFDRLARSSTANGGAALSTQPPRPDQIEDRRLREMAETALARAFAAIDPRDRLLLNYYYFDDLKLREIALLMGVHEATISRWVTRAEKDVRRKTEEILQRDFGLRRAQIVECLELAARSEVDIRNLLRDVKGPSVERAP
ncbi:MAG: sigma-70 family RNA polymerase sigma factor [Acidobacteriota bacterium]|jgi:RNA polymerase sigma-70 factor (ECF subfamily)